MGTYGMEWNMTVEHYVALVQNGLLEEGSVEKYKKVRIPLIPVMQPAEIVTVKLHGHRKFKALVLKRRGAEKFFCVWPAQPKRASAGANNGKVYLQWINEEEVVKWLTL